MNELPEIKDFFNIIAQASGAVLTQYFRKPLRIDKKGDMSPVTIADREAESVMRKLIMERFPKHGIFGEEHARHLPEAEYQWVLDPIDGTKAFISGYPIFTTLISVTHHGKPVLGAIHQPVLGELWLGATGEKTLFNHAPVNTSQCTALKGARIATTSTHYFSAGESLACERLRKQCAQLQLGGDAYAYAMLANGYIDAVIDAQLKPYDFCALVPVIEGAGGAITDWAGNALTLHSKGHVVASATSSLHQEILALLQ